MPQQTIIIAAVIGVVIAFLAVALFLLTRKPSQKDNSSPLAPRNPDYGPRSEDTSSAKVTIQEKPKTEAAPSPLKPSPAEPKAEEKPAIKTPEPRPVAKEPEPEKEEPKKQEPAAKKPAVEEDDDGWGDDDDWGIESSHDLDLDSIGETSESDTFAEEVKAQQEESEAKPKKIVDRRSSEDDDDEWGDSESGEQDLQDGWTGPTLTRVSADIKKAFKDASLSQEFHVSKRKEADDLIVKCVQAYLKRNTNAEVKGAQERVYAIHSNIQLSDLPEIIESFVDSGDEANQKYFADFEDMCNTHEDSVLVLFEKFNTTLPLNLRSRRIAELTDPVPAVLYLAPEWEDDDFDRPDFDERDEDIEDGVDYLEDFYDQLEDDDEEAETDKKQS